MDRLDCDRMFVMVLELGSFAQAAERLGTSASQASKLVSRLERELGAQLFKRSTRAISPTDVGQAYYERVKSLLDAFDALDADVRHTAGAPAGRLRISAPVTFGTTRLAPVMVEFARQYPKVELDVNFSDRRVNIVDEGYDLAIRIGKLEDSSLIARRLCDIRVVTVAAQDYLASHGTPRHWRELDGHDCIVDSNFRDPLHWHFIEREKTALYRINGRLRFSNAEACLRAAVAGLGITRVPTFVAGDALRRHQVVALLRDYDSPPLGLFALYPPAQHLARKSRTFIDFLVEAFARKPEWDIEF
ncbi:LysR family transcriptional regulator [Martelella alba]|uniref:LysR family transcriptional regulator n=1 Tax=Martelella alba TaxID=2590451 RepID=A0ABY2SGT9_9HYPH|nr:LysR family transcriptional regulator [Martelella alba]TKI04069.1 LysR family transcriptional regulator [Martelella alba]